MFDGLHTYNTAGHLRGKESDQVRSWAATTYPAWVQTVRRASSSGPRSFKRKTSSDITTRKARIEPV